MDELRTLVQLGKEMGLTGETLRAWVKQKQIETRERRAEEREEARVKAREAHEREMARIQAEAAQLKAALQQVEFAARNGRSLSGDCRVKDDGSSNMDTNMPYIEGGCSEARMIVNLDLVMSAGCDEPSLETSPDLLCHFSCLRESTSAVDMKQAKSVSKCSKGSTSGVSLGKSAKWPEWRLDRVDDNEMALNGMNYEHGDTRDSRDFSDNVSPVYDDSMSQNAVPRTDDLEDQNFRSDGGTEGPFHVNCSVLADRAVGPESYCNRQHSVSEEPADVENLGNIHRERQLSGSLCGKRKCPECEGWPTQKIADKPHKLDGNRVALMISAKEVTRKRKCTTVPPPRTAHHKALRLRKRVRFKKKNRRRKCFSVKSHRTHCRKKKKN